MPSTNRVLDFFHNFSFEDMPDNVVRQAKICLFDLIGTGIGASGLDGSRLIRNHAYQFFGASEGGARMMFDGRKASAAGAALAGGMTIDTLDCHDGQALTKGHVGCAVLPAILAYYDDLDLDRSGRQLLADLVLGYEIGTRMGIILHATADDYHTSGAWNALTCAGIGARLIGLDHDKTRHALGIGEYHGPRSQMMRVVDNPTMLKDGSGWGAMAGVSGAYLARDGFTGAPAIMVEDAEVDPFWADLGERWYILEQYFKPYPVCRWAQPAITAGLKLKAAHDFGAAEIETVRATTFHHGTRLHQGLPEDTEQAQYGITFPLAAALKHGTVGAAEVSEQGINDPELHALCGKIEILESEDYNSLFPAQRWAHIEVTLKDGRVLTGEPTKADGDPDTPVGQTALEDKFHRLAMPVIGADKADELLKTVLGLDQENARASILMNQVLEAV